MSTRAEQIADVIAELDDEHATLAVLALQRLAVGDEALGWALLALGPAGELAEPIPCDPPQPDLARRAKAAIPQPERTLWGRLIRYAAERGDGPRLTAIEELMQRRMAG